MVVFLVCVPISAAETDGTHSFCNMLTLHLVCCVDIQERSPARESLDATKDASYYSSERPKVEQIVHIDEEVLKLQRESSAFQYLLDVASEARVNGKSEAAPVEYCDEKLTTGIPETRTEQDVSEIPQYT